MNSSTSECLWPSPVAAHQTALSIADSQAALMALIASDIISAVSSGLFSATVSVSGKNSADLQYCMGLLNQGGYAASVSGSTLTVSW